MEEMRTAADPGPAARKEGSRYRLMMAAARRLMLRVASQMASSMSSTVAAPDTPAAWTNPPSEPRAAADSSTAAAMSGDSATSTIAAWATTPSARHRSAVSSTPPAPRSHTDTGRPTSARARAVARPMPDPPPVIRTPVPGSPRRPEEDGVGAIEGDGAVMAGVFQTHRPPADPCPTAGPRGARQSRPGADLRCGAPDRAGDRPGARRAAGWPGPGRTAPDR